MHGAHTVGTFEDRSLKTARRQEAHLESLERTPFHHFKGAHLISNHHRRGCGSCPSSGLEIQLGCSLSLSCIQTTQTAETKRGWRRGTCSHATSSQRFASTRIRLKMSSRCLSPSSCLSRRSCALRISSCCTHAQRHVRVKLSARPGVELDSLWEVCVLGETPC